MPTLAVLVLVGPVVFGLMATVLPAFGFLPSLGGTDFSLDPFRALFDVSGLGRSVALSFFSGLVTTSVALLVVMAFVASWHGTRMFASMQHIISPLLSVPHAAAAFGLVFLIAPSGMLFRVLSPWATGSSRPPDLLIVQDEWGLAMMGGLIVKEIPFLLLVTLAALPQVSARKSAQIGGSFGYGKIAAFLLTTWPLIYRQIRLAVFAVIAYATSVVDVAIILGPSTPPTLAVRLTQWMADPDLSRRFLASAGALLQLAVTVAAIVSWMVLERLASAATHHAVNRGTRYKSDHLLRWTSLALIVVAAVTVFGGLAMLGIWSFAGFWQFPDALPNQVTLRSWTRALPSLAGPAATTMIIAGSATLLAIALALGCLEREARTGKTGGSRALLLVYVPLLVPQVSFVFGLQIFFLSVGWDATLTALVAVHLIFVLPYVFLSLSDPWRAWDNRFASVAHGLGAGRNRTFWRVRLPMLLHPALVAAAVGFAVSVGQYLPTLLIGAGRLPTITTEAVALASGGDRRIIGVYAFVQMLLPFFAFALAAILPALAFRNRADMGATR